MKTDITENIINRKKKVLENINTIIKDNENQKALKIIPKFDYIKEASNIILKYIKDNERKIYGGLAINESIKRKDKNLAIYDETQTIPDYDFYSPEPIKDIVLICQLLHEKGYKNIQCREAQHANTYKLKIERYEKELADISYVWAPYYNMIPTYIVNNIHYVRPDYQIIDMYRAFTNPLFGWYKIDKYYERASLLENLYFLDSEISDYKKNFNTLDLLYTKNNTTNLTNISKNKQNKLKNIKYKLKNEEIQQEHKLVLNILNAIEKNFLKNNKNIIIVGDYAYNTLINISNIPNKKERNISVLNYEIITLNITEFNKELMKFFSQLNINKKINRIFIYPFLEFYDKSYLYTYNSIPLIRVYQTDICYPYNTIKKYNIGSYHLIMQFLYAKKFRNTVLSNTNFYYKYKYMIVNLSYAREYYYYNNNKNGIEESPFQELIINCMGTDFIPPYNEYAEKSKKGQLFNYIPKDNYDLEKITSNYTYPNRSGNPEVTSKDININKLLKYYPEFKKETDFKKLISRNIVAYKLARDIK